MEDGTFKIRIATPADARQIHELHIRSVHQLCKEHYTPQQIEGWLKNRTPEGYLPGINRGEMFVTVEGSRIIGFGHAVPGEIMAVYVDPEYVGRGIGTSLLQHGIYIARQGFTEAIHLDATLNSQGFYERAGFMEIERKYVRRHNVLLPAVGMELRTAIIG